MIEDLDILLQEFGKPAVITEEGKDPLPVTILFDLNSVADGVLTDRPQATLKTADLAGFTRSKLTLTCEGVAYSLMKPLDDGAGLTVAGLKRT